MLEPRSGCTCLCISSYVYRIKSVLPLLFDLHSPMSTQLSPSHGLHISRKPPNLHQLALEDGRQKINERIQWRLQGHRTNLDDASTSPHKANPVCLTKQCGSHTYHNITSVIRMQSMEISGDVKTILCNSPWNRTVQDIELVGYCAVLCT